MQFIQNNRNQNYKEEINKIIIERQKEIFEFFGKEEVPLPFTIYIYDTIEELVQGLRQRGFAKNPDYMCACHKDEDNSLNFFEPKDNPNSDEWTKEEYEQVIFHELIHGITYTLFGSLPEWLCEGIAKYLDGTYQKGMKNLFENYIHKNKIPPQSEIENEFGNHDYDSYDYAYVMVSYLMETLGKDTFIKLLEHKELLDDVKDNLLIKSLIYYNKKYFNEPFYNEDLSNPQWLFHGSPIKLEQLEPRLSHDSDENKANIDTAIFLTSSKIMASAYSFKDTIKVNSTGLKWNFNISTHETLPIMQMENVCIDEDIEGYIYVFLNDGSFKNEPVGSLQFKSYSDLRPVYVIKTKYKDYKGYYEVRTETEKTNQSKKF